MFLDDLVALVALDYLVALDDLDDIVVAKTCNCRKVFLSKGPRLP